MTDIGTDSTTQPSAKSPPKDDFDTALKGVLEEEKSRRAQFRTEASEAVGRIREAGKASDDLKPPEMTPLPEKPQPVYKGPLDAFSQPAVWLAAIGGALTRTPLVTAGNAMADAMNAYYKRDTYNGEIAYQTWQTETKNAIALNKFQIDKYKEALEKIKSNRADAVAELNGLSAAFKDDTAAELIRARDFDQLRQYIKAKDDNFERLQQILEHWGPNWQIAAQKQSLWDQWQKAHPEATADEKIKKYNEIFTASVAAAKERTGIAGAGKAANAQTLDYQARVELFNKKKAELEEKDGPLSPEDELALRNEFLLSAKDVAAGKRADRTQTRLENADAERARHQKAVEEFNSRKFDTEEDRKAAEDTERQRHNKAMEDLYGKRAAVSVTNLRSDAIRKKLDEIRQAQGREPTAEEQTKAINDVMKGGLTGNAQEKLQARVDLYDDSLNKLDGALDVLDKHIGAAGVAGRALRVKERVGDLLGSEETDRVQFMRDIEYLQMLGSRLLIGSDGRPLSSEAGRINDIIGGLSLGDTTANTQRSLNEIKALYAKMRGDTLSRLQGTWQPGGAPGGAPPPGNSTRKPAWQDAPVVQ